MSDKKKIVIRDIPQDASAIDVSTERLKQDIYRTDMEKLRLFTQMLKTNAMYKKAIVSHK